MSVLCLENAEHFEQISRLDHPIVVAFVADWYPPCKSFAPVFARLASDERYGQILFAKAEAGSCKKLFSHFDVTGTPLVLGVVNGKALPDRVSGTDEGGVRKLLESLQKTEQSSASGNPLGLRISTRTKPGCAMRAAVEAFLLSMSFEIFTCLSGFRVPKDDQCFCGECVDSTVHPVLTQAGEKFTAPLGWVRLATEVPRGALISTNATERWHRAYHGCSPEAACAIIRSGFILPGGKKETGEVLGKAHTKDGAFGGKSYFFTSPSVAYAGLPLYAKRITFTAPNGRSMVGYMVIDVLQKPDSYSVNDETMGFRRESVKPCPFLPSSAIERKSDIPAAALVAGLFVRVEAVDRSCRCWERQKSWCRTCVVQEYRTKSSVVPTDLLGRLEVSPEMKKNMDQWKSIHPDVPLTFCGKSEERAAPSRRVAEMCDLGRILPSGSSGSSRAASAMGTSLDEKSRSRLAASASTSTSTDAFCVGDLVRVRRSVQQPRYQWGRLKPGTVGVVRRILSPERMDVEFPGVGHWFAYPPEMEVVSSEDKPSPSGSPEGKVRGTALRWKSAAEIRRGDRFIMPDGRQLRRKWRSQSAEWVDDVGSFRGEMHEVVGVDSDGDVRVRLPNGAEWYVCGEALASTSVQKQAAPPTKGFMDEAATLLRLLADRTSGSTRAANLEEEDGTSEDEDEHTTDTDEDHHDDFRSSPTLMQSSSSTSASPVAPRLLVGSRVRVKAGITPVLSWGSTNPGDVGTLRDVSGDRVEVDFPRHPGWRGFANELEVVPSQSAAVEVGARVRVKLDVGTPRFEWGATKKGDVGTVTAVSDGVVTVNFPAQNGWRGVVSEMEVVEAGQGSGSEKRWNSVSEIAVGDEFVLGTARDLRASWKSSLRFNDGLGEYAGEKCKVLLLDPSDGTAKVRLGGRAEGWVCAAALAATTRRSPSPRRSDLKVGSRVRVKAGITPVLSWGSTNPGDVGTLRDVSGDRVEVDFPRHPGWRGFANELEVVPSQSAAVEVGARVRVKLDVGTPRFEWGATKKGDVGTVTAVSDGVVTVNFPAQNGWRGVVSEMEVVEAGQGSGSEKRWNSVSEIAVGDEFVLGTARDLRASWKSSLRFNDGLGNHVGEKCKVLLLDPSDGTAHVFNRPQCRACRRRHCNIGRPPPLRLSKSHCLQPTPPVYVAG
eukprot:TRINITY_DN157_c0_g1_i3.p1 TRINITY_DN157_c0_g1~~TRINITY_DN157_c0_g1_i3.p1  ORF type:complete len:1165 (-),score=190.89 TRINITY_DN157_c0_g1_i3:1625-5119(-)